MTGSSAEPLDFATLPEPIRARIEAELAPGERLLWTASAGPKPDGVIAGSVTPGIVAIGCAVVFLGCFHLIFGVFHRDEPRYAIEGVVFLGLLAGIIGLIGGIMSYSRWSERRVNRQPGQRDLYALTDRRVVFWSGRKPAGGVEVWTIHPELIRTVHRLEYPDGLGEVRFDYLEDDPETGSSLPTGLVGVAEVRRIEGLTRAVLVGLDLMGSPPVDPKPTYLDDLEEPY